jgi:hypothetical protein
VFKSDANVRTLKTQGVTWMELSSGLPRRIILTPDGMYSGQL